MATTITHRQLADLRACIAREIRAGYVPDAEIADLAIVLLADECDEAVLRFHADRLVAELLAVHRREQETWPPVTDCDRLDRAFAELEAAGIVSRQNFSCCGTCGAAEIDMEMDEAASSGRQVRGYAFFHEQDTAAAMECGRLFLSYGAIEEGENAAVAVGHEVAAALRRNGLRVDWDGRWEHRIAVPIDWKRRR